MASYTLEDGTILNTDKAKRYWEEDTVWNGNNYISKATGSQWTHETLYLSSKGNYWVKHTSQWQGSTPHAQIIDNKEAATWLLTNGHALPEDLKTLQAEIEE